MGWYAIVLGKPHDNQVPGALSIELHPLSIDSVDVLICEGGGLSVRFVADCLESREWQALVQEPLKIELYFSKEIIVGKRMPRRARLERDLTHLRVSVKPRFHQRGASNLV